MSGGLRGVKKPLAVDVVFLLKGVDVYLSVIGDNVTPDKIGDIVLAVLGLIGYFIGHRHGRSQAVKKFKEERFPLK